MKKIVSMICVFILSSSMIGAGAFYESDSKDILKMCSSSNEGTEYWALIVGCNEFLNKPTLELPGNDISAEDLKNLLIISEQWTPNHIRVLTGENATWLNILKGFQWLDEMDDEDDICLFYISTHGMPGMGIDLWPKDEEDGDEFLIVYDTYRTHIGDWFINFPLRTHFISDDMLNSAINRMDAKGVCAIINSCYCDYADTSDNHMFSPTTCSRRITPQTVSASQWMQAFAEDMSATNRVILMACSSDEMSLGNVFSYALMEGLSGFCDVNDDTICSAEEAFAYSIPRAQTFLNREFHFPQHPQIYDGYPGELGLTTREFPPAPIQITGPSTGTIDTKCNFEINSSDPEEHAIAYTINWGDGNEDQTSFYPSGETIQLSHSWNEEGTYNVWFENIDDQGAHFHEFVFPDKISISISDEENIDQQHTKTYMEQCFNDRFLTDDDWLAQSFIPSKNMITKVDLETFISMVNSNEIGPIHVSIRKNLTEEDLTEMSVMPQQIRCHMIPVIPKPQWTTFDIPDISVIPGDEYYIVCRFDTDSIGSWLYAGKDYSHDPEYVGDAYQEGTGYYSRNSGRTWSECSDIHDFCFVTYGEEEYK